MENLKRFFKNPESYENMRNAIGILKLISQGGEDIRKRIMPTSDNFTERPSVH